MDAPSSPAARDAHLFRGHLAGESLRGLGEQHGMAKESVRLAIVREGRRVIDQLHLDLIASHATGELPTLVIPDHAGPDHDLALEFLKWLVERLDRVGMKVRVLYRPTWNGTVVALEDADPPVNSKARSGRNGSPKEHV